jgi:hypothetical protein
MDALTEQELQAAAVSPIGYELDMMAHTAVRWRAERAKPSTQCDAVAEIAYLESMLIHARSLIEFLARNRIRPTDLHRDDFLSAPSWNLPEADKNRCDSYYRDMSKHLAHLTRDRLHEWPEATPPEWLDSLPVDVTAMFGQFVLELTERRPEVAEAFSPTMQIVRTRLTTVPYSSRVGYTTTAAYETMSSVRPSTFDPKRTP